jgi:Ran GTPase-activating protein (RanGAP) involved in mRNA processing and transport
VLKTLRLHSNLKTLELAYDAIGDRGAAALALALGQNRTLTSLDIAGNGIGVAGAQALRWTKWPRPSPNSYPTTNHQL